MKFEKSFLYMLQSVDAFFPIGAFTRSNGLEDYVLRDRIGTADDLREYLRGFLQIFPYNDLGILSLAFRHHSEKDFLLELDGIGTAMKGASEVRMGCIRMCSRYIKAREAMGDCQGMLSWYWQQMRLKKASGLHPLVLGIYGAESGMEQDVLLLMYGYSILSAIVNNTVKLVPLSQMEGQKVLYESLAALEAVALKAEQVELEDLGISGGAYEIHCMNHEQLYSRQYMS